MVYKLRLERLNQYKWKDTGTPRLQCVFSIHLRGRRVGKERNIDQDRRLHEIIITQTIILIVVVIDLVLPGSIERDLGLSSLGLLVTLISRSLLTHFLIARGSQGASNLLHLGTGELLHQSAGEILRPESVLRLLALWSEQGNENIAQAVELVLSGGLEKGHR